MKYLTKLKRDLKKKEAELEDALERVRAALAVLGEEAPIREGTVTQLPAVPVLRQRGYMEASVDDVLALVTTGVSSVRGLKKHLPHAARRSIIKRLFELRGEGMVYDTKTEEGTAWLPTAEARDLNWVENRARELAQK